MGMAFARDEVHWLVRHQDSLASLKDKRPKPDLEDRLLPELLFHVEELRALVRLIFFSFNDRFFKLRYQFSNLFNNNHKRSV